MRPAVTGWLRNRLAHVTLTSPQQRHHGKVLMSLRARMTAARIGLRHQCATKGVAWLSGVTSRQGDLL